MKRTLPGWYEINTSIKSEILRELKRTHGLTIFYDNVPLEHEKFDLSLIQFPLSL